MIFKLKLIIPHKAKTRRLGEGLLIEDNVKITVEKISKGHFKVGVAWFTATHSKLTPPLKYSW